MRLDNFISKALSLSRTEAKQKIKQGEIFVNAHRVKTANTKINLATDEIISRDMRLSLPAKRYLMMNKPSNVVCARQDSEHPTVLDYIKETDKQSLQIVGRLDKDTTGLLLLTDDGQWNHRITSPTSACFKQYYAELAYPVNAETKELFAQGLLLRGEIKPTLPASLEIIQAKQVKVTIQEGKYHQVKRMFAAVDNQVLSLHRESIGPLVLDGQLKPGEYRDLTEQEIQYFA